MIGASGEEHQGAPLDHESSDGRAASMGRKLSNITGSHDFLKALSIFTVSHVGAPHSEWVCLVLFALGFCYDATP
jgi:hypothetical protein